MHTKNRHVRESFVALFVRKVHRTMYVRLERAAWIRELKASGTSNAESITRSLRRSLAQVPFSSLFVRETKRLRMVQSLTLARDQDPRDRFKSLLLLLLVVVVVMVVVDEKREQGREERT